MFGLQRQFREKFDELSYLGTGNDLLMPHIELDSNKEVKVEGCKGIIEYNNCIVKINCGKLVLKITGTSLCLNNLNSGLFSVSGEILSLEFSTL